MVATRKSPNLTSSSSPKPKPNSSETNKLVDSRIVYEFGGPLGVSAIMLVSPMVLYYLWIGVTFYQGGLPRPESLEDVVPFFRRMATYVMEFAFPTFEGASIYLMFVAVQFFFSLVMPGPIVKGHPIPSRNGEQLQYLCNGLNSWYMSLLLAAGLHLTGVFPITKVVDNFGAIMTTSILFGYFVTVMTYLVTVVLGQGHRMSGNVLYDLFMGAPLNPRIAHVDLKMWAEIRIPWILLFFISLSAAVKEYERFGDVSAPMLFMVLAHWLYSNACQKGEECIPTTWDIFYEKWGFMLIFWNLSGVPFTYCYSTIYLLNYPSWHGGERISHNLYFTIFVFALLLAGYYVWDTSNGQRTRFRMKLRKTFIARQAFPQLPWTNLENPRSIKTKHGELLLIDGWWQWLRKPNYTADLAMALSWGLICGFGSAIPYYYFVFFTLILVHRTSRDMHRCALKYGDDWKEYCRRVPYIFIPFVF